MNLYTNQFSKKHNFPYTAEPRKILVIASTGRSGSHMLGHALYETGCFGFPLEYANPANLKEWCRLLNVRTTTEAIKKIMQFRTSPNGVFSIKIHYPHIKQFGGFANLMQLFPNAYYILLSREDLIEQAVSLAIAQQTGVWIAEQEATNENPIYNHQQINECLRETILHNASWRYTLAANRCNYIETSFNYVRNNLADSIKQISKFMSIDIEENCLPTDQVTKKQSNELNDRWVQRFISEFDHASLLIKESQPPFRKALRRFIKKLATTQ